MGRKSTFSPAQIGLGYQRPDGDWVAAALETREVRGGIMGVADLARGWVLPLRRPANMDGLGILKGTSRSSWMGDTAATYIRWYMRGIRPGTDR